MQTERTLDTREARSTCTSVTCDISIMISGAGDDKERTMFPACFLETETILKVDIASSTSALSLLPTIRNRELKTFKNSHEVAQSGVHEGMYSRLANKLRIAYLSYLSA